jgi:hypothetical protein
VLRPRHGAFDEEADARSTAGLSTNSRRIVEVTDEDENLIPEFVSLDPHPFAFR